MRISRVLNYALASVVTSYYIAGSLISTFQCTPVRKAWKTTVPGTCINNNQFRLANGYINILTSFWIIVLPFPALLQVKQRANEVLQLMGLISLGVMYAPIFFTSKILNSSRIQKSNIKNRHTSCAIWRVALMYHPDPLSKTDPQCTFPLLSPPLPN
jgi:hypothetical protein